MPPLPENAGREELRQAKLEQFMNTPEEEMYWVDEVELELPPPAQVLQSLLCDNCGEPVMESRLRAGDEGGRRLCLPCSEGWDPSGVHHGG
jgi:formylmethanofuran dehydrogenase subunit E